MSEILLVVYLNINQLDALNFTISLFHALHVSSTRAHRQEAKIDYTASAIIKPIGGRPVRVLRESSLNLCMGQPPIGAMIPEVV